MALGLFGITSVVAEEAAAPELVSEAAIAQSFPAERGWDPAAPIRLWENLTHSKGSGTAEIVWNAFLANTDVTPRQESFYTRYETAPRTATVAWEVQRNMKVGDGPDNWVGVAIADNLPLANASTGVYFVVSATAVTLTIGQAGAISWHGQVRARLTVTVSGVPSETSAWFYTELVDASKLAEKINEVKEEHAKADRYTDKYRANLKFLIDFVESGMRTTKLTKAQVDEYIQYLDLALAGRNAAGVSVGNIWKLTDKDGDNIIDNFLGQSVIRFYWMARDVISTLSDMFAPIISFFGAIGDIFGNIMPIFGFFTGILGF
jgi:hypothetical protein